MQNKTTEKLAPLNQKESSELKVINKSNQYKQTNLALVNANDTYNDEFVCETKTVDQAEDKPVFNTVKIPTCSSQNGDKNLSESEINPSESKFCTDNSKPEINSSADLPTEPCLDSPGNRDKFVSMTSKPPVQTKTVVLHIVDISEIKMRFKIRVKQKFAKYVSLRY